MDLASWTELYWALRMFFSPEWVRAALVMALGAALLAMLVCAYLGRGTQQTCFVLWTGGWSFYSVYLVTNLVLDYAGHEPTLQLARVLSVGLSAWFFLLGGMHLNQQSVPRWKLIAGALLVLAVNAAALGIWRNELLATTLVFGLMALTGLYLSWRHWHLQVRRTRLLGLGFLLWGANLLFLPWLGLWPVAKTVAYISSALLTLGVAIGLILREQQIATESRYRNVIDAANNAIFVVDLSTLRILDANRAAQRLVQRPLEELRDLSFLDLCPDLRAGGDNLLDHRSMFSALFKPHNEVQLLRPQAGPVLCEGETQMLDWRRRPALQVNIREVDKEKKIGQLVRRAEKMSSLGQLIAGVAHELNNPLAVVVGYAQLLHKQGGLLDEKTRSIHRKILHESERAARIVRDLLSFARPCEPQWAVVDLNDLVGNLLGVREADLRAHQVTCVRQLSADLPRTKADPMQIEQVLTNLITNAIHAMAQQHTERCLTVSTESTGFHLRITIADSGPGIPPEVLGRIFDPFFTTKAPGKGTGLGLSISNNILQEHRGKIWAQSEPGKGAKFFVELPIVACEQPVLSKPTESPRQSVPNSAQAAAHILVVDDEPGICEVVADVLGAAGFKVETKPTGRLALERLRSASFDLIISDLCMPDIDGEELWRQVQQQAPALAKRMVFLTGDTVSPESRAFLEQSGNRWLTKPFNIQELEQLVRLLAKPDPLRGLTEPQPHSPIRRYRPTQP